MLALTRNVGQRLIISDGLISITVLQVKGNQVRLGINAPIEIPVHREEIYLKIKAENAVEKISDIVNKMEAA